MPQLTEEQLNEILQEMCHRVGAKREDFDMKSPGWFQSRSWTPEEELDFIEWLTKYFQKKLKLNKKWALNQARTFCLWYGWSITPEPKQ